MNIFRALGRVFVRIGKVMLAGLRFAEAKGLTDDLVDMALRLVTQAQAQFPDTEDRRDWVVDRLVAHRVPESVARLALELAVQAYKKQVAG